jgi:hypothetical protein
MHDTSAVLYSLTLHSWHNMECDTYDQPRSRGYIDKVLHSTASLNNNSIHSPPCIKLDCADHGCKTETSSMVSTFLSFSLPTP